MNIIDLNKFRRNITVANFAVQLGVPANQLVEQLQAAGISKISSDKLIESDKAKLLDFLRTSHKSTNVGATLSASRMVRMPSLKTKEIELEKGGTKMYCPKCATITTCAAIGPQSLTGKASQRWQRKDHKDIQWFRRARECQSCSIRFLTAELNENFLGELVELRNALSAIKKNAELYIAQSSSAGESLQKLTRSLDLLRALKVYRDA